MPEKKKITNFIGAMLLCALVGAGIVEMGIYGILLETEKNEVKNEYASNGHRPQ